VKLSSLRVRIILFVILAVGFGVFLRQTSFIFSYNIHNRYVEEQFESIRKNNLFEASHRPEVLLVFDEQSSDYRDNAIDFLKQIKMDYDVLEATQYRNPSTKYPVLFLAVESLESVSNVEALFKYVESGGHLFIIRRLELSANFYSHYQKLGITEFASFVGSETIYLDKSFLPDFTKRSYEGSFFWNSSLILQLINDANVLLVAEDKVPLLWEHSYGVGDISYFNGSMLKDRGHHIILLDYLIRKKELLIYPVANIKLVTIGEFPAPLYQGENEEIMNLYSRNNAAFYRDIWWPDILGVGKRYELIFSTGVLPRYKLEDEDDVVLKKQDYIYYAREILNQDGELGYQELSFVNEDGLNKAFLPGYKYNHYIPIDHQVTDQEWLYIDSNPVNVPIVSSLYRTGNEDIKQQSFSVRESGVVEIPIMTKGYVFDDLNLWMLHSGLKMQGIYHHYLTGNLSRDLQWELHYKELNRHYQWLNNTFPYLEAVSATDAVDEIILYDQLDFNISQNGDQWTIVSSFNGIKYFYIHSKEDLVSIQGGTLNKLPTGGYLLEMNSTMCVLEWSRL